MLKVSLVAGPRTELIAKPFAQKYDVVANFNFIDDAVDELITGKYTDIEKLVVLSNGITGNTIDSKLAQMLRLQEALFVLDQNIDLYYMLNGDKELYDRCGETEFKYKQTNIILVEKPDYLTLEGIIEGKFDKKGLFHPSFISSIEIAEEEFYEDVDDVDDPKLHFPKPENVAIPVKEPKAGLKDRLNSLIPPTSSKKAKEEESTETTTTVKKNVTSKASKPSTKNGNQPELELTTGDITFRGIIVVTGDRQSGITTTTANLANAYSMLGLRVLLIDGDTKRKNLGSLFKKYSREASSQYNIANSLYLFLNNPVNIESLMVGINDRLGFIGLAQDPTDSKIANKPIKDLYTSENFVKSLGYVKSQFDIVILDLPLDNFKKILAVSGIADKVVFCSSNSSHSISNLLFVELEEIKNTAEYSTILTKAKLVLTKYNSLSLLDGDELTEKRVQQLLDDLDDFLAPIKVVGRVTLNEKYERQINEYKLANNYSNTYKDEFNVIALNLNRG